MSDFPPEHQEWVREAMDADILEEALARGVKLRKSGSDYRGPCPVCGGTDRFVVTPKKQAFICRGAIGGGVIKMVQHIEGLSFIAACEAINGRPSPAFGSRKQTQEEREAIKRRRAHANAERERRAQESQDNERQNQRRAGSIWYAAGKIDGTPAEAYLNGRGIPTPASGWPECLRFHPSVSYPRASEMPALICRVDNAQGVPVAIWRIFLTADGRKASVSHAKLGLGPASGGAVRIGGDSAEIGIAEGVESALGAWSLIGRVMPVWAALSTSGMAGFMPPSELKRITIFPDGDKPIKRNGREFIPAEPAGRVAASKLRDRLVEYGLACVVATEPPPGKDFLDLWNETRAAA